MSESNKFSIENGKLTPLLLGLSPNDTAGREKLIQYVHGYDSHITEQGKSELKKRKWILGPILNSRPLVIPYENLQSVVFVGANDGMLHAFDTTTGEELWGFVPFDLLGRLKDLSQGKKVKYFVDGSPKAYITKSQKIIIFGLRRGGSHYYALDVTKPEKPKFLWKIGPEIEGFSEMGQTWSTPQFGKVKYKDGERVVCFIGGGYDERQDRANLGIDDKKGRAVYVVDIMTGAQVWRWDYGIDSTMKYTVPSDISPVDIDGDGYIDRLYVGDTGGRLWKIDIKSADLKEWVGKVIFNANPDHLNWKRKIFYRPDVTLEKDYELVFFGTGDQINKDEMKSVNQIYAIKDNGLNSPVSISDLKNVTREVVDPKEMEGKKGWFINFENKGEKVLASPVVLFGVAYFTSFTPFREGSSEGLARIYALDYKTGGPTLDLNPANNFDGVKIDLSDRSKVIGNGFPSSTVISALDGKPVAFTGFSGGVYQTPVKKNSMVIPIWWKEVKKDK
jgi:type IV pilus assembly protein PilY1